MSGFVSILPETIQENPRNVRPVYIAAPKLDTKIQSYTYFYTFLHSTLYVDVVATINLKI